MRVLVAPALLLLGAAAGASPQPTPATPALAHVRKVEVSGAPGAYAFAVTVESPDTGCTRYADWWEVVSPEGELLYRRVLRHSHVDEQPFTRSGGPVPVRPDRIVIVRAHMRAGGYGGAALRGSVRDGFAAARLAEDFGAALADAPPQPASCLY